MRRLLTVIVMVVVLFGASVIGSVAGVKKITPDMFEPYQFDADVGYFKSPKLLRSGSDNSGVIFHAVVKLPVGKIVKKLTHYHKGSISGNYTYAYLYRHLMGENDSQLIAVTATSEVTVGFKAFENTDISFAKIKSGYTYYLKVYSHNSTSIIGGVKITYK